MLKHQINRADALRLALLFACLLVSGLAGADEFERGDKIEAWFDGAWRAGEFDTTFFDSYRVKVEVDGKTERVSAAPNWVRKAGSARGDAAKQPPNTPLGVRGGGTVEVEWFGDWLPGELIAFDGETYEVRFTDKNGREKEWPFRGDDIRAGKGAAPDAGGEDKPGGQDAEPDEPEAEEQPQSKYKLGDRVTYTKRDERHKAVVVDVMGSARTPRYRIKYIERDRVRSWIAQEDELRTRGGVSEIDRRMAKELRELKEEALKEEKERAARELEREQERKARDLAREEERNNPDPAADLPDIDIPDQNRDDSEGELVEIKRDIEPFWEVRQEPVPATRIAKESIKLPKGSYNKVWVVDEAKGLLGASSGAGFDPPLAVLINLQTGRIVRQRMLPEGLKIYDINPSGTKVLAGAQIGGIGVFDMRDTKAKPVVMRSFGFANVIGQATFVGDDRIVATDFAQTDAVLLSAKDGSILYRFKSSKDNMPVSWKDVLADGRWLVGAIANKDLVFVDTHSSKLAGYVSEVGSYHLQAGFSKDGKRLLIGGNERLHELDAATGQPTREAQRYPVISPWSLDVLDDRYLMVSGIHLYDMQNQTIWWRYGHGANNDQTIMKSQERAVYGGRLWYVSDDRNGATLKSVELPGREMQRAENPADLLALKPGDAVSIDLNIAANAEEADTARAGLETALQAAGYRVDPKAPIRLVASTVEGESRKMKYRGDLGRPVEMNVRSKISQVQIMNGRTLLWQGRLTVHPPRGLLVKEGETLQQAINDRMKYNLTYFSKVEIPKQIVSPNYTWGLGETPLP